MNALADRVEPVFEPLLAHLERGGVLPRDRGSALLALLLGSAAHGRLPPASRCGLNPDGMPLQLCVSARRGGSVHVLIGDPGADLADGAARQRASVACARALLQRCGAAALGAALETTLAGMLPEVPAIQVRRPMGALWLAAGLEKPAFAAYAGAGWAIDPAADWARIDRWLSMLLRRPRRALALTQELRALARPESACIEGRSPADARAKLYFRLARADAEGALGELALDDERVHAFVADAVGARRLPLSALVFSVAFELDGGDPVDAKLDLCAHCIPRPADEWTALLRRSERALGVDAGAAVALLQAPGVELACIGIGLDRDRAVRVNTYAKPVRPVAG